MKRLALILIGGLCAAYTAAAQLAAVSGTTNIVITSETVEEPAWKRRVVMKSGASGEIFNDGGKVGSAAANAASGAAAENAAEICDAANVSMTNSLRVLEDASGNAATNAIALALVVRPETDRTNLTAYVVKTETDGLTDTQYVWYNRQIDLAPNRYVVYQSYDRVATNKAEWVNWTNAVTVVQNGRTWQGCHVCTVLRPTWAQGETCLDLPNETLGGPHGFDFGDMLLTVGGTPAYTGIVSNAVTGAVMYFDNGFYKGTPE